MTDLFIVSGTAGRFDTYEGLILAVQDWLQRTDLASRVPDFVRLAEAQFRRDLVMPDMEVTVSLEPAASVALPIDFDSIRALGIRGYPAMDQLAPAAFQALPVQDTSGNAITGQPTKFAIVSGAFQFWPVPDKTYTATLTYLAKLVGLGTGNQANWLLDRHPDAYLYGTLLQAEFFGWNDERLPLIKGALDETLGSIMVSGARQRYGSGPLTMKTDVQERLGYC